jgi:hypothetical protein
VVLVSLTYAVYRAYRGYVSKAEFGTGDNSIRHWTATIAHVQLVLGFMLYLKSPLVKYLFGNFKEAVHYPEQSFFGLYHFGLMLTAIIVITIGSALAKRKEGDKDKFKTMLVWFSIALLIIFIAIPWPFSPLANRPYLRTF